MEFCLHAKLHWTTCLTTRLELRLLSAANMVRNGILNVLAEIYAILEML